ncbi:hypothetical protein F2Q69_00014221 [Brassica cretica]|uniref:Uncharacterized protein n=1 Tax=Brassica cretica TaxID=69181 RepID=A0A8S9QVX5_BRACR|nr:hypothetical protein F2Q69_00014221 [Brassica cretica]
MASKVYDPRGVVGEVKPKNVVIQNQKALGDIGNLVNIPTGKDIARKAEVVVITSLEEDEKSCRPHPQSVPSSQQFGVVIARLQLLSVQRLHPKKYGYIQIDLPLGANPLHRTEPSTGSSSAYGTRPLSPSVVLIRSVHVQIRNNVCLHSYLDKLSVH